MLYNKYMFTRKLINQSKENNLFLSVSSYENITRFIVESKTNIFSSKSFSNLQEALKYL